MPSACLNAGEQSVTVPMPNAKQCCRTRRQRGCLSRTWKLVAELAFVVLTAWKVPAWAVVLGTPPLGALLLSNTQPRVVR